MPIYMCNRWGRANLSAVGQTPKYAFPPSGDHSALHSPRRQQTHKLGDKLNEGFLIRAGLLSHSCYHDPQPKASQVHLIWLPLPRRDSSDGRNCLSIYCTRHVRSKSSTTRARCSHSHAAEDITSPRVKGGKKQKQKEKGLD